MISKSFLKSSLVFTIGGALPMLAGIILLPFYTNYLSEINYTQVLFYISLSLLFQIIFSFSIESYFGIKYTQLGDEPRQQKKFIGTVALLLLVIGAIVLFISALLGPTLFRSVYKPELEMNFWPYGFYSILTAFFNSYFKASTINLIYSKQSALFFLVNSLNFIATLIISIGGLYLFPNTIVGPMYGRLLSGLLIFCIAHYIFVKNGILSFDNTFLQDLFKFCTPYVFYVICIWVLGQIDRYFLQSYIEKSALNAYDTILKCFFGIEFLQNSLSAVIFPKLYEIWNKNKNNETTVESNRYFNVFTAINIIQLILFCIFIPVIYRLVVKNPSFYQSEAYIGVLASGYALRGILNFYLATILFTKKIGVLLKIFGMSAIVQIIITYFAVKHYGLMGAVYAGLATKVLQVLFCIQFTKSVFKYQFNFFKIILIPFIYLCLNLLLFLIYGKYDVMMYLAEMVIFSVLFYLIFKNEIKKVLISFNILPDK